MSNSSVTMEDLLLRIDAVAQTKQKIKDALSNPTISNLERNSLEGELQAARAQLAGLVQQQVSHCLIKYTDKTYI